MKDRSRPLSRVSAAILLFCALAGQAAAAATGEPAPEPSFDPARCEPEQAALQPLDAAQSLECRRLWRERVEAARLRIEAARERAASEARDLRARNAVARPAPVTIETFLRDGDLRRGDIVMLETGPLKFVGRDGEIARASDFVAVGRPRQPERRRRETQP